MTRRTVSITVTFSIGSTTDPHLHTDEGITSEITAWLQSLKAEVLSVEIHDDECSQDDE